MKIAFLSFYSGVVQRGVEVWVDELAARLSQKHEVTVFQGGSMLGSTPYQVIRVPGESILAFSRSCWQQMKKKQFDVVIPTNGGWQTVVAKAYTLFYRKKLIISGQAGIGRWDRFNLWCHPDVFVALSSRGREWAERVSRVRVEKIPNGVDINDFTPKGKTANIDLPRPIILCVAAADPYKRIELTIKAVAGMNKGSLLVLGTTSPAIQNFGLSQLGDRFKAMIVDHDQMPLYYRGAQLFTLVSQVSEAFGIAYLEAMACGLGVVAPDDALRREIIGKAGVFVWDPANITEYKQALLRCLESNFAPLARKQAEKFSWDKVAAKYEKLLDSLK